jgi:hypothetical protein
MAASLELSSVQEAVKIEHECVEQKNLQLEATAREQLMKTKQAGKRLSRRCGDS